MTTRSRHGANGWCFGCSCTVTLGKGLDREKCRRAGCEGQVRRVHNWKALEIGLHAFRLADGYFAHSAAMTVASQPGASALLPTGSPSPADQVLRKNGTAYVFDLPHYLGQVNVDERIRGDFDRIWLTHTFLEVGHALKVASKTNELFKAPELELICHIRNGVAHGNRFKFDEKGKQHLADHPAHNRLAQLRFGGTLEITATMEGEEVLFAFAAPGDLLDLLLSASEYLKKMGVGDNRANELKGAK